MKSIKLGCRIVCGFFALSTTFAQADEVMLQGFDPVQAGPASAYSEAKKDPQASHYLDALIHNNADPVTGNMQAKVMIVEFYDYRCSHCVAMSAVLHNLINSHANVLIVYKEYPIRGKLSLYCAKAALAAKNQGKFLELHYAMMNADTLDEKKVLAIAKSLGMDMDKFQADMASAAIEDSIRSNYQLGHNLRIEGTPTMYIVPATAAESPYLISGEVEPAYLQNLVNRLGH
jgi:protein-disulfide isomerase